MAYIPLADFMGRKIRSLETQGEELIFWNPTASGTCSLGTAPKWPGRGCWLTGNLFCAQ